MSVRDKHTLINFVLALYRILIEFPQSTNHQVTHIFKMDGARYLFVLLSALFPIVLSDRDRKEFAENLLQCTHTNHINDCLRITLEDLRSFMRVGIPALELLPSEPFKINRLHFQTTPSIGAFGVPGVQVESTFSNVIVEGLSKFETRELNADIGRKQLSIALTVPLIRIRGFYKANGKVLVVTIAGNGPFTCNLFNVVGSGFARIVPVTDARSGNHSLTIQDTNLDFDIGTLSVHLDNLFDGKLPVLASTVNEFLNANSKVIVDEVKPQIKLEVTRLVESVMNEAFSKLPVEDFLNQLEQAPRQQRQTSRGSRMFRHQLVARVRHN